jgi:general secretion pathway protein G
MKIRTVSNAGFTLVEIMIVIAIIGMLATVAVPSIMRSQKKAKEHVCFMNRESMDNAKMLWSVENKKGDNDSPSEEDIKVFLKDNKFPTCPAGGTYSMGTVSTKTTCSVHAATE